MLSLPNLEEENSNLRHHLHHHTSALSFVLMPTLLDYFCDMLSLSEIGMAPISDIRVRGGKRSAPNGIYDSWASVCVWERLGTLSARSRAINSSIFFLLSFSLPPFWLSREVRISGHGGHGSMRDDEIYILD